MSEKLYYAMPITEDEFEVLKVIRNFKNPLFTANELVAEFNETDLESVLESLNSLYKKGIVRFDPETHIYCLSNISDSDPNFFRFENRNDFVNNRFISNN